MSDTNIIDRRKNPKGKSLGNRQRFLERARGEIKDAMKGAIERRKLGEAGDAGVSIPSRGIAEPVWHHSRSTGRSYQVVPGNKEFIPGDTIPRPRGGEGGGGSQGSPNGSGEDAFEFRLTREEFLDMFFEDLELPDLVRKSLHMNSFQWARAGYTVSGSPANLSVPRTIRQSMMRRIALRRPKPEEIEELERELERARAEGDDARIARLLLDIEAKKNRIAAIPFIEKIDVRYRRFEKVPKPNTEAVMFCIMDVSGSMTEAMKDLAKRFFMLLHVFLTRRYQNVDVVFIRHTQTAEEVDEETFFYGRETGGTVVSTALEKMVEIQKARYPLDRWNVYGAQASDGDNYSVDSGRCAQVLGEKVLPLCQYYSYIEVGDGRGNLPGFSRTTDLWEAYDPISQAKPREFAMRKVASPAEIWPVFHELFKKGGIHA